MNCRNEKCNYYLVDSKQKYFICPKCGNIVQENINKSGREEVIYSYYEMFERRLKYIGWIKTFLEFSAICMYFVLCQILFGYGGEVIKYGGISVQGRMEILPSIAMVCTYGIIEERSNIFRKFFQYKTFTAFEIDYYRVVRSVIYLLMLMFFLIKGREILFDFMINATHIDNLSIEKFNIALKNVNKGYLFSTIYSFVACIIIEIIDIYSENVAFRINEELL